MHSAFKINLFKLLLSERQDYKPVEETSLLMEVSQAWYPLLDLDSLPQKARMKMPMGRPHSSSFVLHWRET